MMRYETSVIRDWKSFGLVLLALLGGYVVTRLAVGMFFDSAVAAAVNDEAPERPVQAAKAQPKSATAPVAPRRPAEPGWGAGPSGNGSGWNADGSWSGSPSPAGANVAVAAPAPAPASAQPASSNTSRNAGP